MQAFNFLGTKVQKEINMSQNADEGYLKTLQSFFDSNGSERTSDLIIALPGSVTFTEQSDWISFLKLL